MIWPKKQQEAYDWEDSTFAKNRFQSEYCDGRAEGQALYCI